MNSTSNVVAYFSVTICELSFICVELKQILTLVVNIWDFSSFTLPKGAAILKMALKVFTMATKRAKKAARKTEERECELIRLLSVEFMTPGSMPSMALGSHYFLFS